MKNTNVKKDRRKIKIIFRIIITLSALALFVFCSVYNMTPYRWTLWGMYIALIAFVLSIVLYSLVKWLWDIRDLMTEYKEKDNLLSGGLAFTGVFAFVILLLFGLSKVPFLFEAQDLFQAMSTLFVTAMPAFLGLLGVQYSVAIQERNRKQDLRLGAKPFFKVRCCMVAVTPDENGHACHAMKIRVNITNISQSIGIPVKVVSCDSKNCEVELPYTPLANKDVLEKEIEITSEQPYGPSVHIAVMYRDVYDNTYEMKIEFVPHKNFDMSDTQMLSDNIVSNECK